MMILAYLRTKLCSLKTNKDRLLVPSSRSRWTNRFHRPWLGIAAMVTTLVEAGAPPAMVDLAREMSTPPWQTPAVAIVDDLTTTSIDDRREHSATTTTSRF